MHRFEVESLRAAERAYFSCDVAVRFQDVDAAGIVYFARLFDYVHAAYEALLESAGVPLASVLRAKVWAAPLRHAELTYRSPLRFGDVVRVELVGIHRASTELALGHRLSKLDSTLVATGTTVHTFVDPKSFQRISLPPEIATLLDGFGVSEDAR